MTATWPFIRRSRIVETSDPEAEERETAKLRLMQKVLNLEARNRLITTMKNNENGPRFGQRMNVKRKIKC